MTRLILSTSPFPQYWLISTEDPLCRPKMTNWITKTGTLASVTAASGAHQRSHHEGVDQPQRGGNQVLENDGNGQRHHSPVKRRAPLQIVEQFLTSPPQQCACF